MPTRNPAEAEALSAILEREALAEAFYTIANECLDCIDPLTGSREAEDFRRIANRATAHGDAVRAKLALTHQEATHGGR